MPLFVRRHRALALTPAGAAFHREVAAALGALIAAADSAPAGIGRRALTCRRPSRSRRCGSSPACRVSGPPSDVEVYVSGARSADRPARGE